MSRGLRRLVPSCCGPSSCRVARSYFRAKVSASEHVPATGPFILAPVHRSNLDTPLVCLVTRRRLRYMGKESLWKSKFGAWFLSGAGGFPVKRGTADREALRACEHVLERGEPLVLFPEGTRQTGAEVARLLRRRRLPRVSHRGADRAGRPRRHRGGHAQGLEVGLPGQDDRARRRADRAAPAARERAGLTQGGHASSPSSCPSGSRTLFDEAQILAGRPNPPHPDPASSTLEG